MFREETGPSPALGLYLENLHLQNVAGHRVLNKYWPAQRVRVVLVETGEALLPLMTELSARC